MFLDKIYYEKLNEQYLTEEYAKGIMASDYISRVRSQCALMTYIPGFDKLKIKRVESLIERYEDKLELAKKELSDYRTKSKDEKDKLERLNKIDTILTTGIKISVIVLSFYISFAVTSYTSVIVVDNAKKILKSEKIIAKLLKATKIPNFIVSNTDKVTKGVKIAKTAKNSVGQISNASKTMKIGGYEAEIVRCITEMEQLLRVLKNKKDMFEMELDKKEKGLR